MHAHCVVLVQPKGIHTADMPVSELADAFTPIRVDGLASGEGPDGIVSRVVDFLAAQPELQDATLPRVRAQMSSTCSYLEVGLGRQNCT